MPGLVTARALRLLALATFGVFATSAALMALAPSAHALISGVDEATDICAPNADPCSINQVVEVVDGAVLDFGTRGVDIIGSGRIDAGTGDFTLTCGRLRILTGTSLAINMKGTTALGTSAGIATIKVQRRCSDDASILCLKELDCARFDAGACTLGDGSATIGGRIIGTADDPAIISITAAADVDITQLIQANGTSLDSDGGVIDIASGGTITVQDKLQVTSGALGVGGDITLIAHDDVLVHEPLDATGGDFDGGLVEADAGGDVTITEDVIASATAGEGFGGEISVDAGRDITISGGTSTNRLTLQTDGHESSDEFGGDGGIQDYFAGRDVSVGPFVAFSLTGAPPDGFGEELTFDTGRDLLLQGDVDVKSRGIFGSGGFLSIFTGGATTIAATSKVDMTAGDGGGEASVEATGPLTFAGIIDATTGVDSASGFVDFLSSRDDVTISGDVLVNGGDPEAGICKNTGVCNNGFTQVCTTDDDCESPHQCVPKGCNKSNACPVGDSCVTSTITYTGCIVHFAAGAESDNDVSATVAQPIAHAVTAVTAREQILVDTGAAVRTASNGFNIFRYRGAAPVIQGTVSPAPDSAAVADLAACPVCGNATVEAGETCDDGNAAGGDGCSTGCQDEGCITQTPGWPDALLCDDGQGCTADSCDDAANACVHREACTTDGPCTADRCGVDGECLHIPHDDLCDDHISCTSDSCRADGRCSFLRDNTLCDDSLPCTTDTCNTSLGCTHAANNVACNDGNPCTTDQCVIGEGCANPPNTNFCNDGVACTINDQCADSVCAGVSNCPVGQVCDPDLDACGATTTTTSTPTTTTVTTTVTVPPVTTSTVPPTTSTVPPTTSTVPPTTTTVPPTTSTVPPTTSTVPPTTTTVPPTTTTIETTTTTPPPTTTTTIGAVCGNSQVEGGEQCDDGITLWTPGRSCRDCLLLACGDSDGSGTNTASDALFALRAAVHVVTCDCVCDVDGSTSITASDALRLLRKAVGLNVTLTCSCG